MLTKLIQVLKQHTLLVVYSCVLFILLFGMTAASGTDHLLKFSCYAIALYAAYFALYYSPFRLRFTKWVNSKSLNINQKRKNQLSIALFAGTLLFILLHFISLGGSPSLQALNMTSSIDIARHRASITEDTSQLFNYISSISLRAFIPFLILYFYILEKKIFYWIILIIGAFYAFSLMQKSHIVCVIAPILFYSLVKKRFLLFFKHIGVVVLVVFGLFSVANPEISEEQVMLDQIELNSQNLDQEYTDSVLQNRQSPNGRLASGLINRILYVPGKMVSNWFDLIPSEKPFLNGDGYRIVAKIKGTEYHNYSAELYPYISPEFAKMGLKGTVNTASFVSDYANFGIPGLVVSGIILSLLLVLIEVLFIGDFSAKFSLNTYSILIIGSTMLTTTLFSGGWAAILILYALFLRPNDAKVLK